MHPGCDNDACIRRGISKGVVVAFKDLRGDSRVQLMLGN